MIAVAVTYLQNDPNPLSFVEDSWLQITKIATTNLISTNSHCVMSLSITIGTLRPSNQGAVFLFSNFKIIWDNFPYDAITFSRIFTKRDLIKVK